MGGSVCCLNSQYCIVGSNFGVFCCAIGSNCADVGNTCDAFHYMCSTTASGGKSTATASCCPRSCPSTSAYKCASAYGGQCCGYDSVCNSNSACVSTATTSTYRAIVSEIPSGCTTNQVACPTNLGGGCCDSTLTCTVLSNSFFCAAPTGTAVRTGPGGILETPGPKDSDGLSTGAKAGIGAGLAVGACVAVGALLWFCMIHRRHAKLMQEESSGPAMSQLETSAIPRPPDQQPADYFGPAAVNGPFTSDPTSPTSPGSCIGVPISPQSPRDFQIPVEIDSRGHSQTNSNVTSPGNFEYLKSPGTTENPVELP